MTQEKILEEVSIAACACWNYYAKEPLTVEFFESIIKNKLPNFEHSEQHKKQSKDYADYVKSES